MALRHVIFSFLFLFLSLNPQAKKASSSQLAEFQRAKIAYKKGLYDKSLALLSNRYNFKSSKTPSGALELAALVYEKMGMHKDALGIYFVLVKKKYRKENRAIIKSYRRSGNADNIPDEVGEKLSYYYYKKAINAQKLYDENNNDFFYKAALMYAEICMEGDYYDDEAEEILEIINERSNEYKRLTYKKSTNVSVSYMTWQTELQLVSSSGKTYDIKSTSEGTCVGGGVEYSNAYVMYKVDACFALGSATMGEDPSDSGYFQTGVAEGAFFLFPGVKWKPQAGDVSIGFSTPLAYISGDYTEPTGFTLDSSSKIGIGVMLESEWRKKNFGVDLKFGKIYGLSSSTMSLGIKYIF